MRNVLKDILRGAGYTDLAECADGKECMEKYAAEKPDLVLLDIIMPNVDGLEVLKKIGAAAKVVIISAVGQEKMIEEAKKLGALDYIVKPFDNAQVIEAVKKALA